MTAAHNVDTVQAIYADFQAGRMAALRQRLDPMPEGLDSVSAYSLPYAGVRRGAHEVGQFFDALAACVDVESFEPREYITQDDRVIAMGAWTGRARSTGRFFRSDWAMAWTFDQGRLTAFRSFEDTREFAARH